MQWVDLVNPDLNKLIEKWHYETNGEYPID